jgi:formylglycine-generating enzyme required for sulfatase activity
MRARIEFLVVVAWLAAFTLSVDARAQTNTAKLTLERSINGLSNWQRVPLTAEMLNNGDIDLSAVSSNAFYRMQIALPTPVPPPPANRMALIPAGSFSMGDSLWAPGDGLVNELPVQTVNVSAFYMDRYEVTRALWDEVWAWGLTNGYTDLLNGSGKTTNHPVHTITWYEMLKWSNARSQKDGLTPCYTLDGVVMKTGIGSPVCDFSANGYRLPTEAEWEKAARGGLSGKRFPWGDTITHSEANYYSDASLSYDVSPTRGAHPIYATGGFPYSSPVGSFAPNDYGLYDMAGNMYEACWDWYSPSYYASSPLSDPTGPPSGVQRVLRGGSWANWAQFCRVASRNIINKLSDREDFIGFRCVRR